MVFHIQPMYISLSSLDILKPTMVGSNQALCSINQLSDKLVGDDLDSSLANLVGSRCHNVILGYFIQVKLPEQKTMN